MDRIEAMLQPALAWLSRLLDSVLLMLARLDLAIRGQLGELGVPAAWMGPVITAAWVIVVFIVVRAVPGWLRLLVLAIVALVLLKAYGYLRA